MRGQCRSPVCACQQLLHLSVWPPPPRTRRNGTRRNGGISSREVSHDADYVKCRRKQTKRQLPQVGGSFGPTTKAKGFLLSSTRNLVEIHKRVPEGVLGQDARVPNDDAPEASTGKGHVKPARIGKETDALVLVGPVYNSRHQQKRARPLGL